MINIKENEQLSILNHSGAHLLAHAIKILYPNALFWVGPVISDGFYYDIDLGDQVLKEEDLPKIEAEMNRLVQLNIPIVKKEINKEEAFKLFKNDQYKLDLLENMDEDIVTIYEQGDFIDLCRGPHVENTKELKNYKLLKVSGAYYKGDANNKMLQRVYGIIFKTKEDLVKHLNYLEEAKKRDHKKLGKELELFMISEYGLGFPFWLPNGMIIRRELERFWYEEHEKEGYVFIQTPIMLNQELWQISGHWDNYRENMYISEIDDTKFAIKPMNCPGGLLVYKNSLHSYRDLPLRVGELGLVHRHEASGALNGLFRVRNFTQDDAHIFMTEEQIESEVVRLINFIDRIYKTFGLDYKVELSTRPEEKYIGTIETWDKSERILEEACKKAGKECKINPGDGAFYGPKLDFHIQDSLGRVWQCATIQLDANLPERFDLTYIDKDGTKKRPIMLHRVIYGAIERFIGILIEHYGGAFPLWLSPVQVNIIPVNNEYHLGYAQNLKDILLKNKIRVQIDDKDEKLSYKIRESQTKKIPYTVIIGDREKENDTVSYRRYGQKETINLDGHKFIKLLVDEIRNK
ncbi:MAG: threonine--tRNA ligase [Bacilli bacterium]|jgi:threonyl-tRNA synthetase|nr:threonine--tRNA ligase [Bacilli bacterium]